MAIKNFRSSNGVPRPIIKWAGGKSGLAPNLDEMGLIPSEFNDYHEPFVGGAAVFFYLWKKGYIKDRSFLSDINPEIINLYNTVKNDLGGLIERLTELNYDYSSELFYKHRDEFNNLKRATRISKDVLIKKAALFIYLNKTCFNGLYRENSKGEFNVPFGKYKNPKILDIENLKKVNKVFENVTFYTKDFLDCYESAKSGDFVYFDPPYIPISQTSSFTSYHKNGFGPDDQVKLALLFEKLTNKGVKVLLSNAHHEQILSLYSKIEEVRIFQISAPRYISAKGKSRGQIKEYAICNYEPEPNHRPQKKIDSY